MQEIAKKAFLIELYEQFDALSRAISRKELRLNSRLRKRLGKLKGKIAFLCRGITCQKLLPVGEAC